MTRYTHCPQPAYLPGFIIPALCEGHAHWPHWTAIPIQRPMPTNTLATKRR